MFRSEANAKEFTATVLLREKELLPYSTAVALIGMRVHRRVAGYKVYRGHSQAGGPMRKINSDSLLLLD